MQLFQKQFGGGWVILPVGSAVASNAEGNTQRLGVRRSGLVRLPSGKTFAALKGNVSTLGSPPRASGVDGGAC
jgi:hypothetical protein